MFGAIAKAVTIATGISAIVSCGGGSSDASSPVSASSAQVGASSADSSGPDFTEVDGAFQAFLDGNQTFDGISYVVVDAEGILHQAVFGDHDKDLIVMLASTSKVPTVMALLALDEDPEVEFSISSPVSAYLPYDGIYADRTIEQMVSNTSGIPGLRLLEQYGNPLGPTQGGPGAVNHLCQMSSQPHWEFEACGQILVQNELPDSNPPEVAFDYGGSQWQIAGVTASVVANSSWNQLFDQYLGDPCDLEVFTYGNPWEELSVLGATSFDGASVESLPGKHNPQVEGGGISNLSDYAKLLQIHLNGGYCGETQVLSPASLDLMQKDRGSSMAANPQPYGMGWWLQSQLGSVFTDPGAFGAVSFIDTERGIGGFMAIDDYSRNDANAPPRFFVGEAIGLIQAAIDTAD